MRIESSCVKISSTVGLHCQQYQKCHCSVHKHALVIMREKVIGIGAKQLWSGANEPTREHNAAWQNKTETSTRK